MHKIILLIIIGMLLFGCITQSEKQENTSIENKTKVVNTTFELPSVNETIPTQTEEANVLTSPHEAVLYFPKIGLYNAKGMQGEAIILIQGSEVTMIGAGPKEQTETLIAYLKEKKISKINRMIILNAYAPYWDGFDGLSKQIKIEEVAYVLDESVYEQSYNPFMANVKQNYKTVQIKDSMELPIGNAKLIVKRAGNPDLESYAPILTFEQGNTCILYPSSSNYKSQREIINHLNASCPIIVASSHGLGSVSEDMYRFFFLMKPNHVIITGGPDENVDAQKGRGILYNVLKDLKIPHHDAFKSPVTVTINQTGYWIHD